MLILALSMPTVVKLAHGLNDHQHELCTSPINEHLHEQEWDCEFQKFKLGSQLIVQFHSSELYTDAVFETVVPFYCRNFWQPHRDLNFQRGPPVG
ncbi:MAG: hypothetical protein HKN00_09480 [Flavobacteriaceae bacterium]|nr:hypothetical protein [Bacteroidia bacterium]NNF75403.1 hypothetical protein [Flavobacteriaceae bacterium]